MKPLEQYPTPETDRQQNTVAGGRYVTADHSRNLEQRLAACREALEVVLSRQQASGPFWHGGEIITTVRETLELTKP